MKVALVSSYDLEGGAARAAYRLHEALRESGVDASMSVDVHALMCPAVALLRAPAAAGEPA